MTVHMDVSKVRDGGAGLRGLAPGVRVASQRVEHPAAAARDGNTGFACGEAGARWQGAFAAVVDGVERREDWQGEQVVGCADDAESNDTEVGGAFTTIAGQIESPQPR